MTRVFQLFLGLLQLAHLLGLIYSIVEFDALRTQGFGGGRLWAFLPVSHVGAILAIGAMWKGKSMAYVWLSAFSALLFIVYAQMEATRWFGWAALGSWMMLSYFRVKFASART